MSGQVLRMKNTITLLLALVLCCVTQFVAAQDSDSKLAQKYFRDKEYDKAVVLYEKLYKQKNDRNFFNFYIKSLIGLKDYERAEKEVKKGMRANKNDFSFKIEYASILKLQDKNDKATEQFEDVIKNLPRNHYQMTRIANSLITHNEYEYAIKCYKKGAKVLNNPNMFRIELARVYGMQRDYASMIAQYLEILKITPRYYNVVQSNLRFYLSYDSDKQLAVILKKELLKYSRANPDMTGYTELLVWLYLQEKKFNAAYVQVRALDMRTGSTGKFLIEFATIAMNNSAYSIATKAFRTVVGFGRMALNKNARLAEVGLLEARYMSLTTAKTVNNEELLLLENDMVAQLAKTNGLSLVSKLAELQAYYIKKPEAAIALLNKYLSNPRIERMDKAEAQVLLADIVLAHNDPYEAILIYARVEKANKHNVIGHNAKFKKTKVAYFTGDFQWAKAQLDILKASTTKLIANDAFAMSLLIKDNYSEEDSIAPALEAFSEAQMKILQKNISGAITKLDSVAKQYPQETIAEYALFEKGKILEQTAQYQQASLCYKQLIETYELSIWADDATFRLAKLYELSLADKEGALKLYKELLLKHQGSIFVPEARTAFRKLRGDKVSTEQ